MSTLVFSKSCDVTNKAAAASLYSRALDLVNQTHQLAVAIYSIVLISIYMYISYSYRLQLIVIMIMTLNYNLVVATSIPLPHDHAAPTARAPAPHHISVSPFSTVFNYNRDHNLSHVAFSRSTAVASSAPAPSSESLAGNQCSMAMLPTCTFSSQQL